MRLGKDAKIIKNASWIIGCRIVQAVLNLLIGMLTARYLGPSNYGLISYAMSVVAFVTPVMNLGINSILVNEVIRDPEHDNTILGTATGLSLCSAMLCIVGVGAFVSVANPGEKDTLIVCLLYSLVLIAQSLEMIQYWFQAKLLSRYTSMIMLGAFAVISVYRIILLVSGSSVYWFAVANAFDYCIIAVCLLLLYRKFSGKWLRFSFQTAKQLLKNGRYYILSGMMVTIFAQTDRIMLKWMMGASEVGFYSAAVTACGMTGFVFTAIIDSLRPAILENKTNNVQGYHQYLKKLYAVVIYGALLQSVAMTVLAGPIVKILYGESYAPAADALRIAVWYTTFSYMGAVRNIWILAEEKQKYLWIINLSGAVANILLNLVLIPLWGIRGAAFASLVTQFFTNVVMGFIMKPLRDNNRLILQSLHPKSIFGKRKA